MLVSDSQFPSQILDPYIRSLSPALHPSAIWRDADKVQIKYVLEILEYCFFHSDSELQYQSASSPFKAAYYVSACLGIR